MMVARLVSTSYRNLPPRVHRQSNERVRGSSRTFSLSGAVDPDPSNARPELPVSLILAEDHYRFFPVHRLRKSIGSWHRKFPQVLPHDYGIPFGGRTQFRPDNGDDASSAASTTSISTMLHELRTDLSREPQVVLVARGPWYSWLAQCYLESYALAGLVLVDPIQMDTDTAAIAQLLERHAAEMERVQRLNLNPHTIPYEYSYLQHYLTKEKRKLFLEPNNVVPMLVLHSTDATRDSAWITAQRHNVETVSRIKGNDTRQVIELIHRFVQDSVV